MTARPLAPVIPSSAVPAARQRARSAAGRRLPLARPVPVPSLPRDVIYRTGRIDTSGRVADQGVLAALGWAGGDLLTLTAEAGAAGLAGPRARDQRPDPAVRQVVSDLLVRARHGRAGRVSPDGQDHVTRAPWDITTSCPACRSWSWAWGPPWPTCCHSPVSRWLSGPLVTNLTLGDRINSKSGRTVSGLVL